MCSGVKHLHSVHKHNLPTLEFLPQYEELLSGMN